MQAAGVDVDDKGGSAVPYEVRSEHEARKRAEKDLVNARKEVKRLKLLLHNMLDKLKTVENGCI